MRNSCLTVLFLVGFLACSAAAKDTVAIGEAVPNFQLLDQSGKDVALTDFRGKGVILSFLYTRCPYPDKCAMIGKKLNGLAELSKKIGKSEELQVLAITLDPLHDRPQVLKAYARGFDKKYSNWSFLTGKESEIARVAAAFGVVYWEENGVIEHNMRTAFIDRDGKLRFLKSGSDWKPGEFAAEIKRYLR